MVGKGETYRLIPLSNHLACRKTQPLRPDRAPYFLFITQRIWIRVRTGKKRSGTLIIHISSSLPLLLRFTPPLASLNELNKPPDLFSNPKMKAQMRR